MKKSLPARRNKKRTKVERRPAPAASSAIYSFPVIGIGTSAGGLEALEHFLTHVPKNMPCRTLDDRIDGVVITFADITVAKTLEAKLREKHTALEKHVEEESAERAKDSERAASDAPTSIPTKAARKSRRSCNP
jgi:hypothetical protein